MGTGALSGVERQEYAWRRREEGLTWREIGVELGCSGEAVRQMHARHLQRLTERAIRQREHAYREVEWDKARRRWLLRRRRVETLLAVADWFSEQGGAEAFARFRP